MDPNLAETSPDHAADTTATAPWQLALMGRVEAHGPMSSITHWPSRAVAALLARLALAPGRAHGREELVELLWPGVALDVGRARLRQALSNLRSLLRASDASAPELLLANRQTVQLNPAALDCDVLQFERHLAAGRHAAARACYVGDLMPGFYDDWIIAERRRLETLFEDLPTPGPVVGSRQAEPLSAQSRQTRRPRPTLPSYWSRAFGQEAIVASLTAMVQTRRLVTVLGPGGNGKTRLAVATAHALASLAAPAFDPITFVSLVDARSASDVWGALAWAFGAEGAGSARSRVLAGIGQRAVLLVLDNVEQLDDEVGDVLVALLQGCPALHLVLTSRRRLGLPGEQVFAMPGLPVPLSAVPDVLLASTVGDNPCVALFIDRARESRPEFHLTPGNAVAVVGLVRLLGGMPLAIELAASRVRAMQPRELLERLSQDAGSPLLDLLARPAATATARSRHASMRHVVAWSWRELRPEVAELLRAMSVFVAPASVQAVAQALEGLRHETADAAGTGGAGLALSIPDTAAVQALLADALEASLVQAVPAGAPGQSIDTPGRSADGVPAPTTYLLLQPVREYAAEQCGADEPRRARRRLRRWLAQQVLQGMPRQRAALEPDLAHVWNLLLRASDDEDPDAALALGVHLKGEWNRAPSMPDLLAVLEAALAQQPAHTQAAVVSQAHYTLAVQYHLRARRDLALHHAKRAVGSAPDDRTRALGLSILCWVHTQQGADLALFEPDLDASAELAGRSGDARAQALILGLRASVAIRYREDYATAEKLLQQCLRMFDEQGDVGQACFRRSELAICWAWSGRQAQALAALTSEVQTSADTGLSLIHVYALTALGRVWMRMRDAEQARLCLEEAARHALENDWPGLLPPLWLHLSGAWALSGRGRAGALLWGHAVSCWARDLGPINRPETRECKRNRRLLRLVLGAPTLQALATAGGQLSPDEAAALLRDAPCDGVRAR